MGDDAPAGHPWNQRLLVKGLPDWVAQIQTLEPPRVEIPEGGITFFRVPNLVEAVALATEALYPADLDRSEHNFFNKPRLPLN